MDVKVQVESKRECFAAKALSKGYQKLRKRNK